MKIKELHLRNIASIEKADIDFEKNLTEQITGNAAPIFLISGETGSGKSVILDGICMALYKKTPRTEGTANKTKNEYENTNGEKIKINSIEQYTRLGIGPKDECYSEVVFTGNDNLEYRARLTLGFSLGNTDKETGKRQIKYKTPEWKVKVGTKDWIKVCLKKDESNGEPILSAIGLSFEQFNRMAMLAQGQFANFLTGDKKERESILEQLTNTEHFSKYGETINELWKKAKSDKETAQKAFDIEESHTLAQEKIDRLNEAKEKIENRYRPYIEKKNSEISNQEKINQAIGEKKKAEARIAEYKNEHEQTYLDDKKKVKDWDDTIDIRKTQSNKLLSEEGLNTQYKEKAKKIQTFKDLISDYAFRINQSSDLKQEEIEPLKQWLQTKNNLVDLFNQRGVVLLNLDSYKKAIESIQSNQDDYDTSINNYLNTYPDYKKAQKDLKKKEEAVKDKQKEIDELMSQRDKLDANNLRNEQATIIQDKENLNSLCTSVSTCTSELKDKDNRGKEIEEQKKELDQLQKNKKTAEGLYEDAKKALEDAQNIFSTVNSSMEEAMIALRQKLITEHIETCPLCGQALDQIHLEKDFQQIVTPYQKRLDAANEEEQKKLKEKDKAKDAYNLLKVTIETEEKNYKEKKSTINDNFRSIKEEAIRFNVCNDENELVLQIDSLEKLKKDIEEIISKRAARETAINGILDEVQNIQKAIDVKTNEIKPLEQEKKELEQSLGDIKQKLRDAWRDRTDAKRNIGKQKQDRDKLYSDIHPLLSPLCPEWKNNIENAKETLENEGEVYDGKKNSLDSKQTKYDQMVSDLETIKDDRDAILKIFKDWEETSRQAIQNPIQIKNENILKKWKDLKDSVTSISTLISHHTNNIETHSKALEEYYEKNEKTEQDLIDIEQNTAKIQELRNFISVYDSNLEKEKGNIQNADKNIENAMKALGLETLDNLPDTSELEKIKNALKKIEESITKRKGAIQQELNANDNNIQKRDEALNKLGTAQTRYRKWDLINQHFGGNKFRTLVQSYILRPLLNNANIYLEEITDRYKLTCSDENEQLAILVLDKYNRSEVRSSTLLSGGERFMISLSLSLALSSLNRPDMNVNILFIDEGFGTLDKTSLDSVMETLEKLKDMPGQSGRRIGIISHRSELEDRLPVQIQIEKKGEGRSKVNIKN